MSKSFTPYDVQKLKLEKLMNNIDKPIEIPQRHEEKKFPEPPDFVRNVMGSSAGAGSGEFHVYRHLRRKEYARQRYIEAQAKKEQLDEDYHRKLEENKKLAEERTAKKRAKRQKKKQKYKKKRNNSESSLNKNEKSEEDENDEEDEEDEEDEDKNKSDNKNDLKEDESTN